MNRLSPPAGPTLGAEGEACAGCAAPLSADQRYCLNSGRRRAPMRLPFADIVRAGGAPAAGPPPPAVGGAARGERSPLVALGALIVLLLALGIGVLLGRGAKADPAPVARAPIVTVAAPAPAAAAAVAGAVTDDWPAGDEGFTISPQALPATTAAADVAKAKADAVAKGATGAGILVSDSHPSLAPAQFVVYSGSYPTRVRATAALKGLRSAFPDASVVHVANRAGAAAAKSPGRSKATTTPSTAGATRATPGYGKSTKKLPDKIVTPGKAPPVDDKAPGAGSDAATEIG
jgi:hypothetical protein